MHKRLVLHFFLLFTPILLAQNKMSFESVDSITYRQYINNEWDSLIAVGKMAFNNNIDFKYLRQRVGYAYFMKADYYASQKHYEKALLFDKKDVNSLTYLYYCGLYTANETYTRYREGFLPQELKTQFKIKPFKIVSSFDLEYNYKINNSLVRGNPTYQRAGLATDLGYRLNLYQSVSTYSQQNDSSNIKQNEYFALMNWAVTPHLSVACGYHYLKSNVDEIYSYKTYVQGPHNSTIVYKTTDTISVGLAGHVFFSKLNYNLSRFNFGLTGSIMNYDSVSTQQLGLQASVTLPGKLNTYLKTSVYGLFDSSNNNRLIVSQTVGALLSPKLWIEGSVLLGNQKLFTDHNGLYIYNSIDPTTFRAGLTAFFRIVPKTSLYINYSFDNKLIEYNQTNYNQHSFSGGIIWKI